VGQVGDAEGGTVGIAVVSAVVEQSVAAAAAEVVVHHTPDSDLAVVHHILDLDLDRPEPEAPASLPPLYATPPLFPYLPSPLLPASSSHTSPHTSFSLHH
jgi:hypothetical protein